MAKASVKTLVRMVEYLQQPDYLYDLHSSLFAIVVGLALLLNHNPLAHRFTMSGIVIVFLGLLRLLSIVIGNIRLHIASCLMSLMGWLFFVVVFIDRGSYAMSAAFLTFAFASALRYLQLEYWREAS